MATAGTIGFNRCTSRTFEQCRKVAVTLPDVDDADTYVAGPGLLSCAWEVATANAGEGCWFVSDRETGTVTADMGSANRAGTLWLFFGHSGRAV